MRAQLNNEFSSFQPVYRDIADYVRPTRIRLHVNDTNRGERKNQKIIDSTGTMASRTLRAGMMGGITSPARPWFRLTTPDPDLAEFSSVKEWLHLVGQRVSTVFLKSNLYNMLPTMYGDLGDFGTSAMAVEEDFTGDVIRCYTFPIGSYRIANDARLKVAVFMREFRMTVRQLVERFGKAKNGRPDWSVFSLQVKNLYETGEYETWIDVTHFIHPNPDYVQGSLDPKRGKKFYSCYFETGMAGMGQQYTVDFDRDRYLSEGGFDVFPILCPRWEVTGEDVYATDCPGMTALGDIKQLMLGEKKLMQAIEKMVNPPMTGPTSLKNQKATILPGDITFVDVQDGRSGFRPSHEVNPRIAELEAKQAQVRQRISRAYYEDLFLMLAQSDRRQITAREIDERHEEKMLALGPVLEQLNQDALDPLIDITFDIMNRQGYIPPAPEELQGVPLKIEYVSVMAQAQKLIGIGSTERFSSFVGGVAQYRPEVLDKVDADQLIDEYGEMLSMSPKIVRSDEDVAKIRAQREQAAQMQAQAEMVERGASAAKNLSQADMEGDNALNRLIQDAQAGALQ